MTTDITELAQRLARCAKEASYPCLSPADCGALVEALEKAQQRIDELENDEVRQRLANAEHQLYMAELAKHNLKASRKAQFRKRRAAEKRNAELESSVIAPDILRCSECSFVETKNIISVTADTITTGNSKSEPCPNGCGQLQPVTWKALAIQLMFTTKQGVSDLLEAKKRIAELESHTVKMPKPISVLHRREFTEAHCAIYAYPEAEVNAALDGAGIKWEAE